LIVQLELSGLVMMSETRRISLEPLSQSVAKPLEATSSKDKEKDKSATPTVRIEIKLGAKTSDSDGSEFYYPDLFKAAVKSSKLAAGNSDIFVPAFD
jgi:hypothetical protein